MGTSERCYIFARLWLAYPEGTITTTALADVSDTDLYLFLNSLGADWIRRSFAPEGMPKERPTDKFDAALLDWAFAYGPPDADLCAIVGEEFIERIGPWFYYLLVTEGFPGSPLWIVVHAVDSSEIARALALSLGESDFRSCDVELAWLPGSRLPTTAWVRHEHVLKEFQSLRWKPGFESLRSDRAWNVVKFYREHVLKLANIVEEGLKRNLPAPPPRTETGELIITGAPTTDVPEAPEAPDPETAAAPGFMSPAELAARLEIDLDPLRKKLERARTGRRIPDHLWIEIQDRSSRQAKYLYHPDAAQHLESSKNHPASNIASSNRPANPKSDS